MQRILRFALAIIVFIVVMAVVAVSVLFFWLDESSVEKTVQNFSQQALNARADIKGPIVLNRTISLEAKLPAIEFVDLESGRTIGSISGADIDVSLWSIPLGAVHVKTAVISGLNAHLDLPALSGDALFNSAFSKVNFPADLRVSSLKLVNADLDLMVQQDNLKRRFRLYGLTLSMGTFSPEMTTPVELNTLFEEIPLEGKPVEIKPELQAPALPDPVTTSEPEASSEASPESVTDNSATAAPNETTATSTDTAVTQEAPINSELGSTSAADSASVAQESNTPAATAETPEQSQATSAVSDTEATQEGNEPAVQEQSVPGDQTVEEKGSAAPVEEQNTDTEPSDEEEKPVYKKWLDRLLPAAHASDSIPNQSSSDVIQSSNPKFISGALSAKGSMTLSTDRRYVMFEDLQFAGEVTYDAHNYSLAAKADRVRFKGEELNGMNVSASVSRPDHNIQDVYVSAVDFRLSPGHFESPEMRVAFADRTDERVTTYEITSNVDADLLTRKAAFDNFNGRVRITGDKSIPTDFDATVSGYINADQTAEHATAGLSGKFAGAPFSFNGDINGFKHPAFQGELMIGSVDLKTLPRFEPTKLLHAADFNGSLRIGEIIADTFKATQFNGELKLVNGTLGVRQCIVNLADGRLLGELAMNDHAGWIFEGKADGINLDKLAVQLGAAPVVAGVANGPVKFSGVGLDASSVSGASALRVIRAHYFGISADAVRRFIAGQGDEASITASGASTPIDEATAELTLSHGQISISRVAARSVYVRANGSATIDLNNGTIHGKVTTNFAPMEGTPAIHVGAELSGSNAAPVWTFAFDDSRESLQRIQGRPLIREEKKSEEPVESIWQNVKKFFNF